LSKLKTQFDDSIKVIQNEMNHSNGNSLEGSFDEYSNSESISFKSAEKVNEFVSDVI
jgi:hypothetical protein